MVMFIEFVERSGDSWGYCEEAKFSLISLLRENEVTIGVGIYISNIGLLPINKRWA